MASIALFLGIKLSDGLGRYDTSIIDIYVIDALILLYNSWIVPKIDNYNSSMYYENTSYQYASYQAGKML